MPLDPAQVVLVAEAVKDQLDADVKANVFTGLNFEPERSWVDADTALKDCDGLKVDCVGSQYEDSDPSSRSRIGYVVAVEIIIRQKFGTNDRGQDRKIKTSDVDQLAALVQSIHERFIAERRPAGMTGASWQSGKIITACSRKHLREYSTFVGVIRELYNAPKAIAA